MVVLGEMEEQAVVAGLRRFVEDSDLSITRIATLMGVSAGALKTWIEGTTSLRPAKLLEIKGFLRWYVWRDEVINKGASRQEEVGQVCGHSLRKPSHE